ncbi:hypothetical protein [Geobacillus sp. C56-T2]|uniref:hypothetical protein n=1 Tax=Geobacillus sp. C56-T2 TaxID=600773 RepID=UPI0011A855A2|nr:hypothetical protein [Geobacillus sp. C56-T2]NNV06313.1 hypothetical protein [Geobacillus sp. MMMUD3]
MKNVTASEKQPIAFDESCDGDGKTEAKSPFDGMGQRKPNAPLMEWENESTKSPLCQWRNLAKRRWFSYYEPWEAGDLILDTAWQCHFSTRKTLVHRLCFSRVLPLMKGLSRFSPAF